MRYANRKPNDVETIRGAFAEFHQCNQMVCGREVEYFRIEYNSDGGLDLIAQFKQRGQAEEAIIRAAFEVDDEYAIACFDSRTDLAAAFEGEIQWRLDDE